MVVFALWLLLVLHTNAIGTLGPIITYNPDAFITDDRQTEVLGAFEYASILRLAGTTQRMKTDSGPLESKQATPWYIITAGYGSQGNKHAGVCMCLNKTWFNNKRYQALQLSK